MAAFCAYTDSMAKKTEDSIREYLDSMGKDAKPIVDKEAVRSLKAEIKGTSDPIAKLRLIAALDEAEAGIVPDTSGLEAVFVAEAAAWAEKEGIPAHAFQAIGVPDDVLKKAGFKLSAAAASKAGVRAPRLDESEVLEAIKALKLPNWKLSDLAAAIKREPATTRNYVAKLLEKGAVVEAGEDASGPGRAAKLYKLA